MDDNHRVAVFVVEQLEAVDVVKFGDRWSAAPGIVGVKLLEEQFAGGKAAVLEGDAAEAAIAQGGQLIFGVEKCRVAGGEGADHRAGAFHTSGLAFFAGPDAAEAAVIEQ